MSTPKRWPDPTDALAAHVRALVDQAPPLTPAQADRLVSLLRPLAVNARPRRRDAA